MFWAEESLEIIIFPEKKIQNRLKLNNLSQKRFIIGSNKIYNTWTYIRRNRYAVLIRKCEINLQVLAHK